MVFFEDLIILNNKGLRTDYARGGIMNKNYYAIKNVPNVTFYNGKDEVLIEYLNEVIKLNIKGNNILIFKHQVTSDEFEKYMCDFEGKVRLEYLGRNGYGEDEKHSECYKDMRFVKKMVSLDAATPSTMIKICTDGNYDDLKDDISLREIYSEYGELDFVQTLNKEVDLLLEKLEKCRRNNEFNTYKQIVNILRETKYLINDEERKIEKSKASDIYINWINLSDDSFKFVIYCGGEYCELISPTVYTSSDSLAEMLGQFKNSNIYIDTVGMGVKIKNRLELYGFEKVYALKYEDSEEFYTRID